MDEMLKRETKGEKLGKNMTVLKQQKTKKKVKKIVWEAIEC